MTIEDALNIVDSVLGNKSLSTIQEAIFRQTWEGKTYSEIAEKAGYDAAYIRDVGYKLWQLLSEAFGLIRAILRPKQQRNQSGISAKYPSVAS